ncbi:MAG: EF2563 family selenium-dependent molybdenum hydroxylase system protein, partial [Candidatus Marinimicrobia bacterium]|nr:EF2563 family selenium-dependent molybdenum hydroxylase system protein [Candidatus Neomarinimicrobiota bacterium]
AGFPIIALEVKQQLCIRRTVSFASAGYDGETEVEGVGGKFFKDSDEALKRVKEGIAAVIIDPDGKSIGNLSPVVLVDGRMLKKNSGITIESAPVVIALGPGYSASEDVHFVVETSRGHNLGRVISKGMALPDTGIPGKLGGETAKRVLRAPIGGEFNSVVKLGEMVSEGEVVGDVSGTEIKTEISGLLRGLIYDGVRVSEGTKIGDVDPRGNIAQMHSVSDKANAIAGGVMEAVFRGLD